MKYARVTTRIFLPPVKKEEPMSGEEFRSDREKMGLTQTEMGRALGVRYGYRKRTVIAWELEQNKIPPAVEKLMLIMKRYPALIKNFTKG